ncbi:MAG: hypothetical protein QXR01_00870 [Candidatus Bathyarchaeia archaeon]
MKKACVSIAAIFLLLSATISSLWITKTTKAVNGAKLTGNVYDYGLDADGDGLFDYLVAEVEVDVATAGIYNLAVHVLEGDYGRLWLYTYNRTYLGSGLQNVNIRFFGATIRQAQINVTKLLYVYLYDEYYCPLDYYPELNLSKTYSYTQFDEPGAKFTDAIHDEGVDTDGDGLFNYLNISVEVDVTEAGLYEVYIGGLYNSSYNYVNVYGSIKASLTTGKCWLNFLLSGFSIYASRVINVMVIDYVSLSWVDTQTNISYQIDSRSWVQLSKSYNYTDFDYLARLTGKVSDEGVDADGNGLYNYLEAGVEIEVAEAGYYGISISGLSEDGGGFYTYKEVVDYFNIGYHTVYFEYDGVMLAYHQFSPQSLIEIYIRDVNTWMPLDYAPSMPLSRKYNYTLFDAPLQDMQINFTVHPNGTMGLDGLFNFTHMYPPNTGPLMNASLSLSTAGSTTTGSFSGVLLLPTNGMFQWPFNSTTALLKSKIQNGLSNTTLALTVLMPQAAIYTYPFNSSNFELTGRYSNGMLNFNIFGETKLPPSLGLMFPFNATDITVKVYFENGEFTGDVKFYLIPFIPGFLDIVINFDGNKTELRLTDHLNITYGNYPPPIGTIDSTTLENLLVHLNSALPGPNGLIANITNGLIICTQLDTTKTEWSDGNGAEIRYNATLQGNFTMLFAKLLNQIMFGGSSQSEQFAYATLDSVFSSVEKASLTMDYYHKLRLATVEMKVLCNVAELWENALEKMPPTVPPDYAAQITAYLKILNATAYAIKDFSLDTRYSSDTYKLTLNALILVNCTQLEGEINPLLPEIAPNEQLRKILVDYLSVRYCNLTLYDATINYTHGRADFTATWILKGNFKAELNHIKSFYIDYWNATNPWYMPWQLRMLNETIIDANNFSAEIKLGRDWMLLRFNGLILRPPIDAVDNVRFKFYNFFNVTSYDPYEPPRKFQKLKINIMGAFNGTHTILLYAADSVPPPDFVSTDLKIMSWENVSIGSLKNLEFRMAYQQVVNYFGTHNVIIYTNSTMSGFNFNPNLPGISFNVTGAGTGFCQVAIPRTLLYAEPSAWIVKIDDQMLNYPSNYTVMENDDYVFIALSYAHSTHRIEIAGTWVVSEFNMNTSLIILTALVLIMAIAIQQRKNIAKMKTKCKNITSALILKITNR